MFDTLHKPVASLIAYPGLQYEHFVAEGKQSLQFDNLH